MSDDDTKNENGNDDAEPEVLDRLRKGTPCIALAASGKSGIYLNPQTLQPGQVDVIVERIVEIAYADALAGDAKGQAS